MFMYLYICLVLWCKFIAVFKSNTQSFENKEPLKMHFQSRFYRINFAVWYVKAWSPTVSLDPWEEVWCWPPIMPCNASDCCHGDMALLPGPVVIPSLAGCHFFTVGDFELAESVHAWESRVRFIQNGWLSDFIVIKGFRVFCFWLQTHSAYEESVYCCSQGCSMSILWDGWGLLNVPLWIQRELCWRTRGETMQFCGGCGRSPFSHNSDVLVTSVLANTCAKKLEQGWIEILPDRKWDRCRSHGPFRVA